ncbi:hypothetical protein [Paracoccus sp. (in: a-proteobacteria)]|uniref:hypothetical protein n=1 Tax=Paracoccus sp. TaxID=267 RepID=UPI0026DFEAF1|nr:hypothetical protein [Paracoccus sp. (in: a-proteobacteria)]MDO5648150.1 hypothetical protein [Paracoccus sp. (in: a-proteobacteria)]
MTDRINTAYLNAGVVLGAVVGASLIGSIGVIAAVMLGVMAGGMLVALLIWMSGGTAMVADNWAPPPAPKPAPPVMAQTTPDDLTQIKGIGPKLGQALHGIGITRFAQIAAWDDARIDAVATEIGRGAARIRGDDWVGQARSLADQPVGTA